MIRTSTANRAVIYEPDDDDDPVPPDPPSEEDEDGGVEEPPDVYKIRVSGVPAKIISERIEYIGPDGNLITESYKDFTRKTIRSEFASLDDFLTRWNSARKKQAIIDELEEHGIVLDNLAAEIGKDYGDFDLICHVAWASRRSPEGTGQQGQEAQLLHQYGEQARAVLERCSTSTPTKALAPWKAPRFCGSTPSRTSARPWKSSTTSLAARTIRRRRPGTGAGAVYDRKKSA